MKAKLSLHPIILMLSIILTLFACEKVEIEQNTSTLEGQEVDFRGSNATYQFKVASPFFGRTYNAAEASNGDIIQINGEGVLTTHPKSATGNGNFVHMDEDGNILGSGTWTATGLLNFRDNGSSPAFPETFRSGKANINIRLVAEGGAAEFDAILTVYCLLPLVEAPSSWPEAVKVNILGGLNFSKAIQGPTIFIKID